MIVILGNGGHAKVCREAFHAWMYHPRNPSIIKSECVEFDIDALPDAKKYVIGVGDMKLRRALYGMIGDRLVPVFHPSAVMPEYHHPGPGFQLMAGAIVQPGCTIGNNVLINTRASVDHDCIIGDHVHIAPGAILCGGVTVGEGTFIGAGAIIPEGREVPAGAFVKAGSVFA